MGRQNDASLTEVRADIAKALQVQASRATVGRVLQSLDLPLKKTPVTSERDEVKHAAFRAQVAPLVSERFIFVDETSTNTAMTRRYARSPRGQRAYGSVPREAEMLLLTTERTLP